MTNGSHEIRLSYVFQLLKQKKIKSFVHSQTKKFEKVKDNENETMFVLHSV